MKKKFRAPAKINLCLHVRGRLISGYHELAMAMQRVDLYDDIVIELRPTGGVSVCCAGLELADGEENLAARAARLILRRAGLDVGVVISIVKRIPVAAGLGGGSSDAAAVLIALNEMLAMGYSELQLQEMGAELGSDVPFFVFARPAWATGTGVQLEALPPLPLVSFVLVNPGIAVSTADVYQSLRLTKGGELANLPRFSAGTLESLCSSLHNDLEQVVLPRFPVVAEAKQRLTELGAAGTLMSGSGATVFGVFADYTDACRVANALAKDTDWFASPVRPL